MITKNNTFGEVAGALANLDGIVSIQEIINTINQISNFKSKTIRGIDRSAADVYKPFDEKSHAKLESLYVDMTYQRRIRLKPILN